MPRILSVAPAQGLVVEDEIYIPDALNVYWPAGTIAHFWYRRDGMNEVWSIDTGWGRGAAPGQTIAHVAALGFYNWPSRLDYVWRDPVTLRLYHVDILGESTRPLITRDDMGNAIESDFQGKPFAHPNGSFYWTEGTSGSTMRLMVRWSPTVDSSPRVLAHVEIGMGSGYQSGAEVFYRPYAVMPDGDPTVAHTIDYNTGLVEDIGRSTTNSQNRFTESIPSFAAESADLWSGTDSGGAYGFYGAPSSNRLRASFVSSNLHRVGLTGVSSGAADNAIDTGARRHTAMHFNAARTLITVYPFTGSGTALDPFTRKVFDPGQPSSSEINSNDGVEVVTILPLVDGDYSTSPHQVWPWGPVA